MATALDNQPDVVLSRCKKGMLSVTVGLSGERQKLTKPDAQLDMAGFCGVDNEDRISPRAAWSTLCWKAGVVGPLVPVHGDGVCLVEVVG
jgi:hypothetical protein